MSVRVLGIALTHDDKNFAAFVGRTGDEPLMAIQNPFVTVTADIELDIGRITGGNLWLGHGVGGADLSGQQRCQPIGLLRVRAKLHQHFHIAGVWRIAVEHLRRPDYAPHFFSQRRVIQKAHAAMIAVLGVFRWHKEIPEPRASGLVL